MRPKALHLEKTDCFVNTFKKRQYESVLRQSDRVQCSFLFLTRCSPFFTPRRIASRHVTSQSASPVRRGGDAAQEQRARRGRRDVRLHRHVPLVPGPLHGGVRRGQFSRTPLFWLRNRAMDASAVKAQNRPHDLSVRGVRSLQRHSLRCFSFDLLLPFQTRKPLG